MEPFAVAGLVMIGAMMTCAAAIGAVGGVITALLRRDLAVGALATVAAYLAVSPFISRLIGALVGFLPLMVTFVVAALATGRLQASHLPKPLVAVAGLILGLGAGFLYLMPLKLKIWMVMDKSTVWIALAILLCLIIGSIRKRRRVAALTPPSSA